MPRRHRVLRAMLAGALMATLTGGAAAQSDTAPADGLDSTNWSLTGITTGGATTSGTADAGVALGFVGGRAGGSAGCDRYLASYATVDATLTFGPVETTRTPCDDATRASMASYLTALSSVATFAQADGALTLLDADGATVLTFEGAPMPTVEGSWTITGVTDGSTLASPSGAAPSLAFLPSGRVEGHGGCNPFHGPFGVSGSEIAIGPLMSAIAWCDDGADAQELQLLSALQQAFTWSISSGTLELRDYEDALVVTADPASAIGRPTR